MKRQKHRRAPNRSSDSVPLTMLISALRTLAVTLTTASLLTVGAAALLSAMPDPILGVSAAAYAALTISCVVGGLAAWLSDREHAELTAVISGGMLVMLLFTVSAVTGGLQRPVYTLLGYASVVLVHFLIAKAAKKFLGTKKRKRRYY